MLTALALRLTPLLLVPLLAGVLAASRLQAGELVSIPMNTGLSVQVQFSPDSRLLAYFRGGDTHVHVWDVAARAPLPALDTGISVARLRFSPDSRWMMTASGIGIIQVWEAATGERMLWLDVRDSGDWASGFTADGALAVATASADGLLVRLWDAATGRARDTLRQPDLHPVDTLLSRDAVWLVTRDMDNTLRLWDVAAGRERAVMNDMRARVPTLLTPDGRLLTYQLPHALVWEMESGALAGRVDGVSLMTASVRDDGAVLLAGARAGSGDGRIFVYDLSSAHRPSVSFTGAAAAFSPDGTALAAIVPRKGSKPSEMWLWESAGWSRRVAWRGAGVWLWYSPDGEHIALLDAVGALRVLAVGS